MAQIMRIDRAAEDILRYARISLTNAGYTESGSLPRPPQVPARSSAAPRITTAMTTFDLVARGEPRAVNTILRTSVGEHFPSSQLGDTAFDLALGPMPMNRYLRVHAAGRWVPEADGVRIVGYVELTQQTRVLYGGALVVFVLSALVMTVRAANPLGLVGMLVGGGALVAGLARARARALHGAADRLKRLMGEVEALARLQGGGGREPQTRGRQF